MNLFLPCQVTMDEWSLLSHKQSQINSKTFLNNSYTTIKSDDIIMRAKNSLFLSLSLIVWFLFSC